MTACILKFQLVLILGLVKKHNFLLLEGVPLHCILFTTTQSLFQLATELFLIAKQNFVCGNTKAIPREFFRLGECYFCPLSCQKKAVEWPYLKVN